MTAGEARRVPPGGDVQQGSLCVNSRDLKSEDKKDVQVYSRGKSKVGTETETGN